MESAEHDGNAATPQWRVLLSTSMRIDWVAALVRASEVTELWPAISVADGQVDIAVILAANSPKQAEWLAMKALHQALGETVSVVRTEPSESAGPSTGPALPL